MEEEEIRALLAEVENPFTLEGSRQLLKDNPYDNMFESLETRDFISPTEDSMFLTPWDDPRDVERIERKKEDRQPWRYKFGAGVARVGTKVAAEIAKMPGVLGGVAMGLTGEIEDAVTGQDNNDFVQTAFNNAWIQSINDAEEFIKEEALPVYVKKAIREGNLIDNIFAIDFWATEGADGLGYIISMLAPGAAINKFGVGAKLLQVDKLAQMAAKTKNANAALKSLNTAWINPKNADLFTGSVANTLFEAAAEAKSSMDHFVAKLDNKLASGEITQQEYDEKIKKQSEVGRDVFLSNAAILIGPNLIMSKMLWGRPTNSSMLKKVRKSGKLEIIKKPTLKQIIKEGGDDFAKAAGREGFWEEGMQSTVENYFTEKAAGEDPGTLAKAYMDMLVSTEGQKAILLGAAFGGGMQAYTGYKGKKADRKNTNKLVEAGNKMLTDFYNVLEEDIHLKDKDGNPIWDEVEQRFQPDLKKIIDKLQGANGIEAISAQYDIAIEDGNTELVEEIRELMTNLVIKPFLHNDSLGIDALKKHLEASKQLAEVADRENINKDDYIKNIIEKATVIKNEFATFKELGQSIFKLADPRATESERTDFYNKLASKYMDNLGIRHYANKKMQKAQTPLEKLLEEKGHNLEEVEKNNRLRRDLYTQDTRVEKLYEDYNKYKQAVKEANDILNKFWDGKTAEKDFSSEITKSRKIQKENQEKADEIIKQIKSANTEEELNDIENMEGTLVESAIKQAKEERLTKINEEKAKSTAEEAKKGEQNKDDKDKALGTLTNFSPGEVVTIPDTIKDPRFAGKEAIVVRAGEKGKVVLDVDGVEVTLKESSLSKNITEDPTTRTEGGKNNDIPQEPTNDTSSNRLEDRGDARIIITDNSKEGKKLGFISDAALEFERTPRDKKGETKNIEVNIEGFSDNQKKAIEMVKNNDFSNPNFLIKHLPLNVILSEGVVAPLETYSDKVPNTSGDINNPNYNDVWNMSSRWLRQSIIKELANGTNIKDITVTVAGQANGDIQLDPNVNNLAAENPIAQLHLFSGDMSKIKADMFYIGDEFGRLVNGKGEFMSGNVAPGEIYLKIMTASGLEFPLKLNVKKISEQKAEVLYELFSERFKDFEDGKLKEDAEGKDRLISDLPQATQDLIMTNMSEELALFKKPIESLRFRDIIDLLVYDNKNSSKARIIFRDGKLKVATKEFTEETFNTPEGKDTFITVLTENKRTQIKFKKHKNDSNDLNIQDSRKYLEYLLNTLTLSTNAVTGKDENGNYKPTFAGKTTIYLDTADVRVKDKKSKYNKDVPKKFNKNLIGTNAGLQSKAKGLFTNKIELNDAQDGYVDENGKEYKRVSTLKDSNIDMEEVYIKNSAKRGNTVDELTRLFFTKKGLTIDEFIQFGKDTLAKENKSKPGTTVQISDQYYRDLFLILEQYKEFFNDKNWTIFANSPAVGGVIGNKGSYAGTMDLLAFDNSTKEWIIIDLKTSTTNRAEAYKGEDRYGYKKKDSIQQNAYKELLLQKTGIEATKLYIMPLISKEDSNKTDDYVYSDISKATDEMLIEVDSTSNIYEILGVQKVVEEEVDDENDFESDQSEKVDMNQFLTPEQKAQIEELQKKKKKKISEKVIKPQQTDLATVILQKVQQAIKDRQQRFPVKYNGNEYMIFGGEFVVYNSTKQTPVISKEEAMKVYQAYNETMPENIRAAWGINIDYASAKWDQYSTNAKEEAEAIKKENAEAVKVENPPVIEFTDYSKTVVAIMKTFPQYIKELQSVITKDISNTEKLSEVIKLLESKGETKESIKTKCKL